jgi:hypothetical protein
MADTKISGLPAAGSALTTDEVPVNEGGATKKVTVAQIIAAIGLGTAATHNTGDYDASGAAAAITLSGLGGQPLDSDLTALAGLAVAADTLPYGNGTHTMALATFTAAGRAILDDAAASDQRTTLGLAYGAVGDIAAEADGLTAAAGAVGKVSDAGHRHPMGVPAASQSLSNGTQIAAPAGGLCPIHSATAGGSKTLTATPTISAGANGQKIVLLNTGAAPETITLQDATVLAGSGLALMAGRYPIAAGGSITMVYSSDLSLWVQVGIMPPPGVQAVNNASTIASSIGLVPIKSTTLNTNRTIGTAPSVSAGLNGQEMTLLNVTSGTDTITIQDDGTLAGSNLMLVATTVVISPHCSVKLTYSSDLGSWVQIGALVTPL